MAKEPEIQRKHGVVPYSVGQFDEIHQRLSNIVNWDWQATCSIYPDFHTETAMTTASKPKRMNAIHRSFEIPLESITTKATFYRLISPDGHLYRVWRWPSHTPTPVVRLTFVYYETDSQGVLADGGSLPSEVGVSLQTPYPDWWPVDEHVPWLTWLEKHANILLCESDFTSYCVCTWIEHHAISDFPSFVVLHLDDSDGHILLQFKDQGPTHYDTINHLVIQLWDESKPPPHQAITKRPIAGNVQRPIAGNVQSLTWWYKADGRAPRCIKHHVSLAQGDVVDEFCRIAALHGFPPIVCDPDQWRLFPCPICFDDMYLDNMVKLPQCNHRVCSDCLPLYLRSKVEELWTHRDNPFRCPMPDCRVSLPVLGFVKQFLTDEQFNRVRAWYKDLKQPPCHSLPNCLSDRCGEKECMRKMAVDSPIIFCETCDRHWCEWCLLKVVVPPSFGQQHRKGFAGTLSSYIASNEWGKLHVPDQCESIRCLQFCQRYLAANARAKESCEARYPWIKTYASVRLEQDSPTLWLREQKGQRCPVCRSGVIRSEGCFHIHCTCGAHFCYECGEEIFPPFYGTHHCWESIGNGNGNN